MSECTNFSCPNGLYDEDHIDNCPLYRELMEKCNGYKPEPDKPVLPEKLGSLEDRTDIKITINAIIDYLKAKDK